MESLLYGQIIDTLKCLSFDQLFALKQTNKYFNNFIGRYEHLLAKKEIKCIHISILKEEEQKNYKIIDLNSGIFNFTLNNEIENKWKSAIDNKIPTYLNTEENPPDIKEIIVALDIKGNNKTGILALSELIAENSLILKLPIYPKNIEELKIIYCWLFHLFRCCYSNAIINIIFNPELIQILFEENIQIKFHLKVTCLNLYKPNNENVLKFTFDHLIIERLLLISQDLNTESLLKLMLNGGDIIRELIIFEKNIFDKNKQTLHNLIIKLIETSKDFSKMISIINIYFNNCPRFNPSIRAENVKKRQGDVLCVSYKLSNIYNPVRYTIMNSEDLLKKFL